MENIVSDTFVIESHHFQTRKERSDQKFNLLTKDPGQVWDCVVFCLINYIQGRYRSHEVVEVFEVIKSLKGIETGTVKYILKISVSSPYPIQKP